MGRDHGRDLIKVEGRYCSNEECDGVGQWAWQVCVWDRSRKKTCTIELKLDMLSFLILLVSLDQLRRPYIYINTNITNINI